MTVRGADKVFSVVVVEGPNDSAGGVSRFSVGGGVSLTVEAVVVVFVAVVMVGEVNDGVRLLLAAVLLELRCEPTAADEVFVMLDVEVRLLRFTANWRPASRELSRL